MARINVPDIRFNDLVERCKPKSIVPAQFNITDIAGLVKGASEGKGLGNAFLSHINAVDGIFHVIRAFEDDEIIHDEGDVNPVRDMNIIHSELMKKDNKYLVERLEDLETQIERKKDAKMLKDERDVLQKVVALFEENLWVKDGTWSSKDIEFLNRHTFLTAKPVVYLVNISEEEYRAKQNKFLGAIKEWIDAHGGGPFLPFSAAYEARLVADCGADEAARKAFEETEGLKSMINRITKVGYKALNLGHYFTSGPDEVRAWTVRLGWKAPQAAGIIHTDFEKGFICAEIMQYKDLKEQGDEHAVKAAGLYKQKGKDYEIEDGDIILFKFNAPK